MKIEALYNRVCLAVDQVSDTSEAGIEAIPLYVMDGNKITGVILSLGEDVSESLPCLEVGQRVVAAWDAGVRVKQGRNEIAFIKDEDVLGYVE